MRTIIITEYGIRLIMGVSFDISNNTLLEFRFKKPDESLFDVTATLGTIEITTTAGVFSPNTWAEYTFVQGDIDQDGEWRAQLRYTDITSFLLSSLGNFTVTDNAL